MPATVAGAVRNLKGRGVTFTTVHGNQAIMEAAAGAADGFGILAVTVLTSLDRGDLDDLGFQCDVEELVLSRARRALAAGCAGVVSSGLEAKVLRAGVDDRLIVVTPGIRPVENRAEDDQKRVVSVAEAFANGADYIVVGRPIRDAADPRAAAESIQATIAGLFPAPMSALQNDRLLRALAREPVDRTPVWFMRQAGRYLPEYRATRAKAGSFLGLATNPELACEVTLQPLARFSLDAAILFSDILMIPKAMGVGLAFEEGEGPRIERPVRSASDIDALPAPDLARELRFVFDAVALIRRELSGRVPLIGFAGSPWTVATYMIEGGSSRDFARAKALALRRSAGAAPAAGETGARDDRVPECADRRRRTGGHDLRHLGRRRSRRRLIGEFSLTYMEQVVADLIREREGRRVPVILFTKGGGAWLERMAVAGADALGVDWMTELSAARRDDLRPRRAAGQPRPGRAVRAARGDPRRGRARAREFRPRARARLQPRPRHPARRRPGARCGDGRGGARVVARVSPLIRGDASHSSFEARSAIRARRGRKGMRPLLLRVRRAACGAGSCRRWSSAARRGNRRGLRDLVGVSSRLQKATTSSAVSAGSFLR